MSNIWCRLHVETLHDVKVQRLPPELFKAWVNMLLIAKLHDGVLPDLGTVAYHLHLSEQKAGALVGKLAAVELLDPVPGGYYEPHNWHQRQYVNQNDPTAVERNKRHRKNKKIKERNGYGDVTSVTVTAPEQSIAESKIDDDDDARARAPAKQPWELEPCHDLARQLAEIAGCADEFEFTGWGGATYRVKQWLESGWKPELIIAAVREQAGKKRDGPAKTIKYFEPGIASAIAKANQPLPNVVQIPAQTVEISSAKPASNPNSATAVARRVEADIKRRLAADGLDSEPYQPTYLRLPAG